MTLALALILDAALGEPRLLWDRWPHPAVLMGRAVDWADRRLNDRSRARGVLALALLASGAAALGLGLAALPGALAEVLVGAVLLAQRSLCDHVRDVARGLRLSVGEGRRMVARIVGRDTAGMDGPAVARAAIESAAENFSDGVLAPAFWFAVAGLPGLLIYKVVNTADSMIGHRTPRHEAFGWAAARADDALNWVPARLSALLLWLAAGPGPRPADRPDGWPDGWPSGRPSEGPAPWPRTWLAAWRGIARDARLHRSPNAGWPEAAMARALGVALAGPRSYHGRRQDFPWVHPEGRRAIGPAEVEAAVALLWRAWALLLALAVLGTLLL